MAAFNIIFFVIAKILGNEGRTIFYAIILFLICGTTHSLFAQLPGLPPAPNDDTTIVFTSPRPLISDTNIHRTRNSGFCGELYLSNHGFGFGCGYQIAFTNKLTSYITFGASGARNSDELEVQDLYGNVYVPNKVNRLLMFPLFLGGRYRVFKDDISESLRPHISAAIGTTFIMSGRYPGYEQNFFGSITNSRWYVRPGGYIGIGANTGALGSGNGVGVDLRYYIIPFGGNGLESIRDLPLHDFGGIFLSFNIGVVN